jgi:hypothetical protein
MMAMSRLLPWVAFYGDYLINFVLDIWLLRVLFRYGGRKDLPWFFVYVVSELLFNTTIFIVGAVTPHLYQPVYWCLEIPRVILLVAAVQESLLQIFSNFRALLRWTAPVIIAIVALYSLWRVNHTPFPGNHLDAFATAAEFAFRSGISVVCMVMLYLIWAVPESRASRAEAMIEGAAISSISFGIWSMSLSAFGDHILPFVQYLPDLGYFLAVRHWIKQFARPVVKHNPEDLAVTPLEAVALIRKDRRDLKKIGPYIQ